MTRRYSKSNLIARSEVKLPLTGCCVDQLFGGKLTDFHEQQARNLCTSWFTRVANAATPVQTYLQRRGGSRACANMSRTTPRLDRSTLRLREVRARGEDRRLAVNGTPAHR